YVRFSLSGQRRAAAPAVSALNFPWRARENGRMNRFGAENKTAGSKPSRLLNKSYDRCYFAGAGAGAGGFAAGAPSGAPPPAGAPSAAFGSGSGLSDSEFR